MSRSAPRRFEGDAVLLLITLFWGATFVVVKGALSHSDPFSFLALRFGVGALVVSAFAGRALKDRDSVRAGLLLGVFLFLGFAFQTTGLVYTTPSRSAFLTGLSVLLVPFVSLGLYRRWPKPPTLLGVGLAVVGLYALTGGLSGNGSATWRGDLLTLGCAVAYAFQITLTEQYAPRTNIAALVATQLWTVTVLSVVALAVIGSPRFEPTWSLWGAIAFCGLFASAGAIFVQTWAQARTTAVRAALIFSLEPVFAAITALLVGREVMGRKELVGGALIVLGVVVAEAGNALWARWWAKA